MCIVFVGFDQLHLWSHSVFKRKQNSVYVARIFIICDKWLIKRSNILSNNESISKAVGCLLLFAQSVCFPCGFVQWGTDRQREMWIVYGVRKSWWMKTTDCEPYVMTDSNKLINTSDTQISTRTQITTMVSYQNTQFATSN